MKRAADVVIVGGGVHGCSAALQIARRGKRVIVLERQHVARHASGTNAGGVRTNGRDLAEVPLSVQGMALWRDIVNLVGDDCGFSPCGHVRVAETPEELAALEARARQVRQIGFDHEVVIDAPELRRLVPALAPRCAGALVVHTDGQADPYRTTLAFAARARSEGVEIIEGEGAVGFERRGDAWTVIGMHGRYEAGVVVNASGAWAARTAQLVGDAFPLSTRASMMIVTERMPPFVTQVVGAVGRKLSFKQTTAGTVLIGGGQQGRTDLDREQGYVDVGNLASSADTAIALFPRMRNARIVRSWCGIEAQTPDQIPVIGFSPSVPGFIHVFGFSGHGFQLGPICGVAIADLATRGETALPIAPFAPQRFAVPAAAAAEAPMGAYLLKRLLLAIPTLVLAMTVVFILARVVPGDPAMVILGDQASAESLAALRTKLGLDLPLLTQYWNFLAGILTGDLGQSMVTGKSVWAEVLSVIGYTIELTLAAIFLGVLFGVPLGVYAAVHRNRLPDTITRLVSLAGLSFPAFVSAILLLLVFAIQLRWFPVISAPKVDDPLDRLRHLALPAINLGLIMTAYVTRVTRSSMLNVLSEDYVRTARAKGIGSSAVLWRHALRNALIPVATVVGLYLGTMIGNSVLTEIVFNRPGLGKLILGALNSRDYTMLQGLMVFFAGFIVLANAATDIAYGVIDPRVRYQ